MITARKASDMSLSPMQLNATAEKYVISLNEGNLDGLVGIYAEGATVEDPVGGGNVHSGLDEIRAFYATVAALDCTATLKETRPCGNDLLFNFSITTHFDENTSATIDVWDLMVHNEEGKVTSMKAYWGPENMS